MLNSYSNSDFVAVLLKYKKDGVDQTLICCSAYFPYQTKEFLIGCDANSHNIVWG